MVKKAASAVACVGILSVRPPNLSSTCVPSITSSVHLAVSRSLVTKSWKSSHGQVRKSESAHTEDRVRTVHAACSDGVRTRALTIAIAAAAMLSEPVVGLFPQWPRHRRVRADNYLALALPRRAQGLEDFTKNHPSAPTRGACMGERDCQTSDENLGERACRDKRDEIPHEKEHFMSRLMNTDRSRADNENQVCGRLPTKQSLLKSPVWPPARGHQHQSLCQYRPRGRGSVTPLILRRHGTVSESFLSENETDGTITAKHKKKPSLRKWPQQDTVENRMETLWLMGARKSSESSGLAKVGS